MKNRVVVTGLGVCAANGIGIAEFWQSLIDGKSGIGSITRFDASMLGSQIAGEVKGFDPARHLEFPVKKHRMSRQTQLALASTRMALEDAKIDPKEWKSDIAIPVMIGVSSSAFDIIEHGNDMIKEKGPAHNTPFLTNVAIPQGTANTICEYLGLNTQALTLSTACAAGLDAVGLAAALIRSGQAEMAIAGGADAPVVSSFFSSFDVAGLSSTHNTDPTKASRPFDLHRDSGVIAEGSGIVILEDLEHALARGVDPYLEVTGYATHMDLDVKKPASGFENTMKMALAHAGRSPADVDYVCAHGPGHPVIDRVETEMIKRVFGKRAYQIPVSSIKGVIGNPFAAAGPMQLIACALATRHRMIPQTANYETFDPDCDLDYVPGASRTASISCAMINIHGIGGANSSLVVERIRH